MMNRAGSLRERSEIISSTVQGLKFQFDFSYQLVIIERKWIVEEEGRQDLKRAEKDLRTFP